MERRRLGADGPEISVVGIGTAPIGSSSDWISWVAQDEADAVAAIHAALDAGANWIDTAGDRAPLLGAACERLPHR